MCLSRCFILDCLTNTMKRIFLFLLTLLPVWALAQNAPKREFRGAWIQIINGQFQGMSRHQMQANLTNQLNVLQACGINTVIFQVRGEADAFYESPYEPWSRFLTGTQGTPPSPYWDPLTWMVEECHKRNMELHAWINPFRAKTKGTTELAVTHPYIQNPERFFSYGDLLIFDPGQPENHEYICKVVEDIVKRYDIDGLHIDDYFYPYPEAGKQIPDDVTFTLYSNGYKNREDWRRYNVNCFIEKLSKTIHRTKPWVKFGVSPFGIFHNEKAGGNIPGSKTNGLQNYDDLYADILYWVNKGWVDYNVPQIYWEIGHKAADYDELIHWWSRYAGNRPLIIGQDVERTVRAQDLKDATQNQMAEKFRLQRSLPNIDGSCMWYSAAVVRNEGGYASQLAYNYHATPALQPLMPFLDDKEPKKVKKLKDLWMPDGYYLFWQAPSAKNDLDKAHRYVVYRFADKEKIDLENPKNIVMITSKTMLRLPYKDGKTKYTYVVTALDRLQNESKAVKRKVKL